MDGSGVGAALNFAGALVGAGGQAAAARKQNKILAQGSRDQSRAGMESTGVMNDFLTQLRGSAPRPEVERGAFSAALGTPAVSGPVTGSARFAADAAGATAGAHGYGTNLADLFSRIRAPQLQRQQESQAMVRMGDELRPIQSKAQDSEFLTNLRAGMKTANPWTQLLGQGMQAAGSYAMANSRSGAPPAATPLSRMPGGYVVNTPGY